MHDKLHDKLHNRKETMSNNNTANTSGIVSKVWAFCQTLRDDGVGYGDYLEQLTYFLFLKMADEYSRPPHNRKMPIPTKYNWETLTNKSGDELEVHYNNLLRELAKEKGILGQIFTKSQNKITDPAKLYKLIALINAEQWVLMGVKDKGDIYEGLLEKNAEDTKSGAGQYFTPRPLIKCMVECLRPEPMRTIADPACGTGGFFLAAYDWMTENNEMDKAKKQFLKYETFFGNEIVAGTRRLALMNLFLHNIGDIDSANIFISPNDSLIAASETRYDYVLANPPFGKKSSMTFTNEEGEQEKEDLTYPDQIKFIQQNLQKDGNLLLFFNNAGYSIGNYEENIQNLTGMKIKCNAQKIIGKGSSYKELKGIPIKGLSNLPTASTTPLFYVDDATAIPLASISGTNKIGAAIKNNKTWSSVYLSLPGIISPEFIRGIAKLANVVPVGPQEDVTYAGNGFIVIHAMTAGEKTLQWEGKSDLFDITTGTTVAKGAESFAIKIEAFETRWYKRRISK